MPKQIRIVYKPTHLCDIPIVEALDRKKEVIDLILRLVVNKYSPNNKISNVDGFNFEVKIHECSDLRNDSTSQPEKPCR